MGGGAAVLAALGAIAELGLPLPVLGVLPACENMIGPDAIRPSDVITTAAGLTVEVTNPDAEGRLILADALWYARRQGATHVVDLATLTGAMRAGMGDLYGGVFANDDDWRAAVVDAGNAAGDLAWPWPLHRRYRRLIESRVADLRNTSGRPYGYPITAATLPRALRRRGAVGARRHARARAAGRRSRRRDRAGGERLRRAHARRARRAPGRRAPGGDGATSRRSDPAGRRIVRYVNSSVCAGSRAATTVSWCGEKRQTGSVAAASPVRRSAWQRQPPKSSSWRPSGHERHGSCIQSVPRKRVNASDSFQIQSSERSRTFGNSRPGIVEAAWHGSASPFGAMTIVVRPQPPMHGFGSSSK